MQVTAGVVLSTASAAIAIAVSWYAWRQEAPGATGAAAFTAAAALWAAGNAVQVASTDATVKQVALAVQYVGITVTPVAWFAFAAGYTDRDEWLTPRVLGALAVVPVVVLGLAVTNDFHHLVRETTRLQRVDGVVRLEREFGPAFWVGAAYANLLNAAGTVLLLEAMLRVGRQYRRQTMVVLAGAVVPWLAAMAFHSGTTVVEPEAFVGVTAAAFAYAIARYELFDLVPVAHDRVLTELDDGVLVVDGDRRIADYNPGAERLLGVELGAGDRLDDVLPSAVLAALDADHREPVSVDAGDGARWLTVRRSDVSTDDDGELLLLRDVTELERQRHELDLENERLERVADTISHDLRNPLTVADGYLDLAEETGDPEQFDRVRRAHDRMDDIIEGTLRLARAGVDDPETTAVSLPAVTERAWTNVPTESGTLDVATDEAVVADPEQLESLLENVFRNAVEHGSTGNQNAARSDDAVEHSSTSPDSQARQDAVEHGPTSRQTQSDDAGEHAEAGVTVTVGRLDDGEGFYVADDGPGIPAEERGTVFDRGYTTNDDGTGLGLAIVRDIAEAHDWTVTLDESDAGGVRVGVAGVEPVEECAGERPRS